MPELRARVKNHVHYYHAYVDGDWKIPVAEHLDALEASGLRDVIGTDFYVGFVGSDRNIVLAEAFMRSRTDIDVIARFNEGWEQVTMGQISAIAEEMSDDGAVLYAHTKGSWAATQPSPPQREDHIAFNNSWRRSMQHDAVDRWQECVALLDHYDAVGGHIIDAEYGGPYYAGTYWWATAKHIRSLPPLQEDHRYRAEKWIGDNPNASLFDIRPGWPGDETLWRGE